MSQEHEPTYHRAERKAKRRARLAEVREQLLNYVQPESEPPESLRRAPSAQEEQVSEQVVRGLQEEAPTGGEGEAEVENLANDEDKPATKRKRSTAKRSAE
jgi:hypothetical protein